MGFDGGGLRTASPTSTGHASAQREVGRLVLKPPPSVSTLAFRKSVLENAIALRHAVQAGFWQASFSERWCLMWGAGSSSSAHLYAW